MKPNLKTTLLSVVLILFSSSKLFSQTIVVSPKNLLNKDNFQFVAEYIVANAIKNDQLCDWHYNLYRNFTEINNPKDTPEVIEKKYLKGFERLKDLLKKKFDGQKNLEDLVAITSDYKILSNSAVVAVALLCNQEVFCEITEDQNFISRDCLFYKEHKLKSQFLDQMAIQYTHLNGRCHFALVWPHGMKHLEMIKTQLSSIGSIIYEKKVVVKGEAKEYLLSNTPPNIVRDWKHLTKKYFPPEKGPEFEVSMILFETSKGITSKKIKEIRKTIRNKIGLGQLSIHIDQKHQQSTYSAKHFLPDSCIFFMNHFKYSKQRQFPKVKKNLDIYKKFISSATSTDNFCVDSASVLAIHGLRDTLDVDFFAAECELPYVKTNIKKYIDNQKKNELELHNFIFDRYKKLSVKEVLFNPEHHFYYDNLKFLNLQTLRSIKKTRAAEKHKRDLVLIDTILK